MRNRLRSKTQEVLPQVLAEKIEFKDLRNETRQSLARYAIERRFAKVVDLFRRQYRPLTIAGRVDLFVIAEIIERDFYHLGTRADASRIDIMVLTAFRRPLDEKTRAKHTHEKEAVARWINDARGKRSDQRRFSGAQWGFDQAALEDVTMHETS